MDIPMSYDEQKLPPLHDLSLSKLKSPHIVGEREARTLLVQVYLTKFT